MHSDHWYLFAGAFFVLLALTASVLQRLPLSFSLLYLAAGFGLGKAGLARVDLVDHRLLFERVTEVAVLVSLFTAGLKLRPALTWKHWGLPVRLALVSMLLTVGAIAAVGVWGLGLPLSAALLLGAILAPTDPVLAAGVSVEKAGDTDALRFGLTGEAGLNDGTAFPLVMLGLALLQGHTFSQVVARWVAVDLLWAVGGGIGVGFLLGHLVARGVLYLRTHHREAVGLDDFLGLGLVALAYGLALALHTSGFLAVFAAGLALRRIEARANNERPPRDIEDLAKLGQHDEISTHPEEAPAYMAAAVLGFNQQLERIAEMGVMVLTGLVLASVHLPTAALWFVPLLLGVIRPLSVWIGVAGSRSTGAQRNLIAWFGIRGVGSLYYLFYSADHGLALETARQLGPLVLAVIAASVIVHGISVTPLMRRYGRQQRRRSRRLGGPEGALQQPH